MTRSKTIEAHPEAHPQFYNFFVSFTNWQIHTWLLPQNPHFASIDETPDDVWPSLYGKLAFATNEFDNCSLDGDHIDWLFVVTLDELDNMFFHESDSKLSRMAQRVSRNPINNALT